MSLLFISHDVGQVAERADQVVVLYAGQIAERGDATNVLTRPRHPYTRGLIASIPPLRTRRRRRRATPTRLPSLRTLEAAADGGAVIAGCRFAPRCPEVFDRCLREEPDLLEARPGWWARCFLAGDEAALPLIRPSATAAVEEGPSDGWESESGLEPVEEALEAALEGDIERQAEESQRSDDDARDENDSEPMSVPRGDDDGESA